MNGAGHLRFAAIYPSPGIGGVYLDLPARVDRDLAVPPAKLGVAALPSPQAVVTFVALMLVLLIALRVPLAVPPVPSALTATLLSLAAAWLVNRRVPDDEDDDITEDARSVEVESTRTSDDLTPPGEALAAVPSDPPRSESGAPPEY